MGPGSGPSGILATLVAVVDKSASSAEEETLDRRSQILICETADSASARGRPSAPGMIQPAGNPEKNQRTC